VTGKTGVLREKSDPVLLCASQLPHGVAPGSNRSGHYIPVTESNTAKTSITLNLNCSVLQYLHLHNTVPLITHVQCKTVLSDMAVAYNLNLVKVSLGT